MQTVLRKEELQEFEAVRGPGAADKKDFWIQLHGISLMKHRSAA